VDAGQGLPFDSAMRQLQSAHYAALGTLEAELQRMRQENTLLRARLAEAGVQVDCKPLSGWLDATRGAWGPLPSSTSLRPAASGFMPVVVPELQAQGARAAEKTEYEQDLEKLLEAFLANNGWQHIEFQQVGPLEFSVAGIPLHLQALHEEGSSAISLMASEDEGHTWESFESLVRRKRLHKVVRAAPFPVQHDDRQPSEPLRILELDQMKSQHHPHWKETNRPLQRESEPTSKASGPMKQVSFRHDGLPTFSGAFDGNTNASAGPSMYYTQFAVPAPRHGM